ncbi:MAG: efflux RND transporter periplasmic adaptor subunit [Dissulfurispiraceae bacterium]|jgi:multidrug efflux pump subunit AcrA (membrane-fusion protein)|nr:efflux RND transporter periplasmic adaptor subunit [Dissulfurispiraceae bacterium]
MKKILAVIVVLILAITGYFGYKAFFKKPATQILETTATKRGNIRGILVETGITKSQVGAVVKIGARATGTIIDMKVRVGDKVKKGELIALIDDREIKQSIEQTQASLEAVKNTLLQHEQTYPEKIREAKANYEYASAAYKRETELLKNDFTTKDAVEKSKSLSDSTSAILERLRSEYKTQVQITKANIDDKEALLQQQNTKLSYTKIYSPLTGIVSEVTAQKGETIVAGLQVANLVTVLDPTRLEMWIYVDETDIGRVKLSQKVEYYVDTYPNKTFHGLISEIYPQPVVKDNIVYYLAIVKIPVEDSLLLRPEMTTHVKIIFKEKTDVLTVANAAVKFEKGKQILYLVKEKNQVQKVEIKTGIRGEEVTEIISGAEEGSIVASKLIVPFTQGAENKVQGQPGQGSGAGR